MIDFVSLLIGCVRHQIAATVSEIAANRQTETAFEAIANFGDAQLRVTFYTLEILFEDEIDNTGDGIRTVNRRSSAGQYFDTVDKRRWNHIKINDTV
ncbi:MAG: hypothetical protein WA793_08005 [Sphingorhabdus sp.]